MFVVGMIAYFLFYSSCHDLEPVAVTKFSNVIETSSISFTSATVKSKLMDIGENINSYGHCWATIPNPTINDLKTSFIGTPLKQVEFMSELDPLNSMTKYYVRAYVVTELDTFYSNETDFSTLTLSDINGNDYKVVKIGTQLWMAENLKTTRYNDGIDIPRDAAWQKDTTGAYAWFNNEEVSFKPLYGALYNWFVVNTGKICPSGWHLPSDAEWTQLTDYLGGIDNAGGKLKESGTAHWDSPNTGATNETGFTALPSGCRYWDGTFSNNRACSYFWSATKSNSTEALYRGLYMDTDNIFRGQILKQTGFSVRCLKN